MGYKLAGFDVLGYNEIDPRMAKVYNANHHPKYRYVEPIQDFKKRRIFPNELYHLDILDGSPPCSSFSMAGVREQKWGVSHKFREGQADQVLDTLFFDFIDLANKLRPKVVIAENVKGILLGKAKPYADKVIDDLHSIGYLARYQTVYGVDCGLPQRRVRVIFYAVRKDLWEYSQVPVLVLPKYQPISFSEFYIPKLRDLISNRGFGKLYNYWKARIPSDRKLSDCAVRAFQKYSGYTNQLVFTYEPAPTISASNALYLYDEFRGPNLPELCCIGSWPQDYNFVNQQPQYIIGMSVPPLMMYQVAKAVDNQILSKIQR